MHLGNFYIFIAAFLDNEINILDSTLESYKNIEYVSGNDKGTITVELIYNTSANVSQNILEAAIDLENKWNNCISGPCKFKITKNPNSSSKADNVNLGLSNLVTNVLNDDNESFELPDYIGIFDADHQPDPMSILHAAQLFREGSDIIQGHCTVRNYNSSIISSIVAVEFEDLYNLGQEGRYHLYNLALFSGSVGFWKSSILMNIKFDGDIMTEDIDSSFRAKATGSNIVYSHNIKSTELATASLLSLIKQRQRWGQGWLQTSMKHLYSQLQSEIPFNNKCGIWLTLFWCEVYPYFTFTAVILSSIAYLRGLNLFTNANLIVFCYLPVVMNMLRLSMVAVVADGPVSKDKKWSLYFFIYYNVSLIYQALLNTIKVSSHWRQLIKKNEWIVTSRDNYLLSKNNFEMK